MSCTTDWLATGTMIGGLGTWASAFAIGGAAWIGRDALSKIKARKFAERRFDAAEQILSAAYRVRDAITGIRPRLVEGHESAASEQALRDNNPDFDTLSENEKREYVQRGVIYKRAEFYRDDFTALFEAMPVAKIFFGDNVEVELRNLARARQLIFISADMLPTLADADFQVEADREFKMKLRRSIYGGAGGDDEVSQIIATAIANLESELAPALIADGQSGR